MEMINGLGVINGRVGECTHSTLADLVWPENGEKILPSHFDLMLARAHHLFRPNISSRLSECETHRDYLYGQTYRDDFGRVEIKAAGLSIACRYIKQGLGVSRWYVKSLAQGKVGSLKGQTMVCLQCDEGRWVGKQLSIGTFCRWKLSHVCVVCLLLSDA